MPEEEDQIKVDIKEMEDVVEDEAIIRMEINRIRMDLCHHQMEVERIGIMIPQLRHQEEIVEATINVVGVQIIAMVVTEVVVDILMVLTTININEIITIILITMKV